MPAKFVQDSRTSFIFPPQLLSLLRQTLAISYLLIFITIHSIPVFAEELIKNSGFESGTEHWQDKVSGATIEESSEAHSGTKAIQIIKSTTGSGGAQQTVTHLEVGNYYKISVKAKRISESGSGKLRIAWYEEGSTKQKDTVDSSATDSLDWSTIEMVIQVPDNIATAKIRLLATSTDDKPVTILFDDLEITVTQPTATLAPSPTPTPTLEPTPTDPTSPTPTIETPSPVETSIDESTTQLARISIDARSISPTPNAQILGSTTQETKSEQSVSKPKSSVNPLAIIIIVTGGGMLGTAGYIYARDSGMLSQILQRTET